MADRRARKTRGNKRRDIARLAGKLDQLQAINPTGYGIVVAAIRKMIARKSQRSEIPSKRR